MAIDKYTVPLQKDAGSAVFSDNLVGFQLVTGGGLTQGNFDFTTSFSEKVNRTFNVGAFAQALSLDDLNISNVAQGTAILDKQFRVYPNYDVSQVLNFSLYGSLSKRFSVSVTKIINYFPGALEVVFENYNYSAGDTAINKIGRAHV